ncbi:MAG: EAL domain-containing protein [Gammaproteobacteria bacterium]|nr:EAL domain-containing protein [Gammaproteobacteria bacterium]
MNRPLLPMLRRLRGWRLNVALVTGTVSGALLIVALMDLLLNRTITADYLLTGLVASGLVAPAALGLLDRVLTETYGRDRALLNDSRLRTEGRLAMAIDVTQIVLWELDINTRRLIYDESQLASLGIFPHEALDTLEGWIDHVHPEDRAPLIARIEQGLAPGARPFDFEYRLVDAAGGTHWIHTRARVSSRAASGAPLLALGTSMNITARKRTEEALRASETRARELAVLLRLMCDNVPDLIWAKDPDRRYLFANKALCGRLLNAADTEEPVGRTDDYFADRERSRHPDDPQWHAFGPIASPAGASPLVTHSTAIFEATGTVQGQPLVLEIHEAPFYDASGTVIGTVGSARDVTERKRAEEQLHLAASVFTHAREGIMITAADGAIIDVNDAFTRITGYTRDEVLGRNPRMLNSGIQDRSFFVAMWKELVATGRWSGEVWNRRCGGEIYAALQTISAVPGKDGRPRHYVALFSDITRVKEQERQLERSAHYDALTGLPNRLLLGDRLRQAMAQADRHATQLAVAYLDLDGFKTVNDVHGHDVGDRLLVAVSARMREALREADTFARLGGDEFVAVLPDLGDAGGSEALLGRVLAAAASPIEVDGNALQVSASLGVTYYPQGEGVDADHLLRQADQAMYEAKLAGRNCYHVFDADHDRDVRGRHANLERMRQALARGEFELHYQPKVNLATGTVVGVEALIRWRYPAQGLLPPIDFLPIVEGHPLDVDIGEWVLARALEDLAAWRAAGLRLEVSVNVSPYHLQRKDFVERLQAILAAHPEAEAAALKLEVLETSAFADLERVTTIMAGCRALGVRFALDDFGTGYSSLTYLRRLPVEEIKMDRSFVQDMLEDDDDLAIVTGVLGLARAFQREPIAEGVESVAHGAALLKLGCPLVQGFGIAEPMPAAEIADWVRAWPADPCWRELATRPAQVVSLR